jgi:hypothetical protein
LIKEHLEGGSCRILFFHYKKNYSILFLKLKYNERNQFKSLIRPQSNLASPQDPVLVDSKLITYIAKASVLPIVIDADPALTKVQNTLKAKVLLVNVSLT